MLRLGIDLGGTGVKVGLVDADARILHKDKIPTGASREYTEIIKDIALLANKVINDAGYTINDIESIGVGIPGTCDVANGILVYTNNINFKHVPFSDELYKYFQKPIYIDNDANCAALGEAKAGATVGINHSIAITLGTGLGGGIIIDGKIYAGFNYSGAELGHMVIVTDGVQCTCGRKGCFESYASATGLIRMTKEMAQKNKDSIIWKIISNNIENVGGKTAFEAARRGDKTGQTVVDMYIKYLAAGLTNIINIFAPEKLVIGGGVCNEGDALLSPLKKLIAHDVYCKDVAQTEVVLAKLGNDAGIIGAAFLGA